MGDGGYLLRRLNIKAVRYENNRKQNPYGLKQDGDIVRTTKTRGPGGRRCLRTF